MQRRHTVPVLQVDIYTPATKPTLAPPVGCLATPHDVTPSDHYRLGCDLDIFKRKQLGYQTLDILLSPRTATRSYRFRLWRLYQYFRHSFITSEGEMFVPLGGVVPVFDFKNQRILRATTVRIDFSNS